MYIVSVSYDYDQVKVGDAIQYRPSWGDDPPRLATVVRKSSVSNPGDKEDGQEIESAARELVDAQRVVFDLDNGHWCYSKQVDGVAVREDVE